MEVRRLVPFGRALVTGDVRPRRERWAALGMDNLFPVLGGHESSGVVVEVGLAMWNKEIKGTIFGSLSPA